MISAGCNTASCCCLLQGIRQRQNSHMGFVFWVFNGHLFILLVVGWNACVLLVCLLIRDNKLPQFIHLTIYISHLFFFFDCLTLILNNRKYDIYFCDQQNTPIFGSWSLSLSWCVGAVHHVWKECVNVGGVHGTVCLMTAGPVLITKPTSIHL